jgi:hypothetical protein
MQRPQGAARGAYRWVKRSAALLALRVPRWPISALAAEMCARTASRISLWREAAVSTRTRPLSCAGDKRHGDAAVSFDPRHPAGTRALRRSAAESKTHPPCHHHLKRRHPIAIFRALAADGSKPTRHFIGRQLRPCGRRETLPIATHEVGHRLQSLSLSLCRSVSVSVCLSLCPCEQTWRKRPRTRRSSGSSPLLSKPSWRARQSSKRSCGIPLCQCPSLSVSLSLCLSVSLSRHLSLATSLPPNQGTLIVDMEQP